MSKGLTYTAIFEAMSLNYGEGTGNISELKKITKGGETYTYVSRQAIRYDIYRLLRENFFVDDKEVPLTKEQQVVQFKPDANIKDYVEMDLFGYMKTAKGQKSGSRPAVVRISPAISLEPTLGDIEFGTNKNFADRVGADPNPFQFENHYSLYTYTITIDLDKVGKDENDNIDLSTSEKADRVKMLLEVLKVLNRNIKGRIENLNPVFAIGGVYNIKNPFFLNRIKVKYDRNSGKYALDTEIINSVLDLNFGNEPVRDKTYVGYLKGYWANEEEFNKLVNNPTNIGLFFENLENEVFKNYGVEFKK
ncbi:type I-B CRISPR-associated protein Cas7/Cst2/DevR [Caldisericum exile]|uniref:CRISPR-associated protein n=1 Tax=Caldisericum exile (strain DSM 21853 / NBRC 104410 / AZM16c01) TaxID=511051 RepID=A0A7U6GDI8_CALEA|nr:type I-B CRISPR-associated protein Cas7/Cst2/DevR [Caldisericum exile]BAL80396.1 putative CRISPR-associated protein [Caldisericum exile AZM16c01]